MNLPHLIARYLARRKLQRMVDARRDSFEVRQYRLRRAAALKGDGAVTYRVLDLFSGIGGMSLGLERAGDFETVAFCENNRARWPILKKHWPDVPIIENVKRLPNDLAVDMVAAGFPCQDISFAGKGAGLAGLRSRLFWRVIRAAGMVGWPRLLLENVAALLNRGMGDVLGALAQVGYGLMPTIGANEGRGSSTKRYRGSPHFRGAKMSEGLRTCQSDPTYTHPNFAEAAMGFPKDWTLSETP